MSQSLRDALLSVTKALPNGAAAVNSDGIDLGHSTNGEHHANCVLLIESPALLTGDLADAATLTFDVDDSADNSSFTAIAKGVMVQTGAGGAGAAAKSVKFRLPPQVRRYVRVTATKTGAGDASDKSLTASLVF
jgi:hypothetical protein